MSVRVDTAQLRAGLGRFADQIPFATSLTINRLIAATRPVTQKLMSYSYDKGVVPYTTRALYYTNSSKRNLHAALMTTEAGQYIKTTADGGTRHLKTGKRAAVSPVPDGKYRSPVKLTAVGGNVPHRLATKLLGESAPSFVGARQYGKSKQSGTGKTAKYFSGKPAGKTGENYAGVWMRVGKGGREGLKMVLKYDTSSPRPVSLPVYDTLQDYVRGAWDREYAKALREAVYSRWGR